MQCFDSIIPDPVWRKAVFDEDPIPSARIGMDHRFLEVNDAYCAATGYARAELLAKEWQSITHPEDVDGDLSGFTDLVSGKRDFYQTDKRYLRKFGGTILGTLFVRAIKKEGQLLGFFVRFVPIIENITSVSYSSSDGRAIYETRTTLSPTEWIKANPWPFIILVLGMAFLLGVERVANIIQKFLE